MKNREQKTIYYLMALALSLFALLGCAIIEGPPHFSEKPIIIGLLVYIIVGALYGITLKMGKVKKPFLLSYAAGSCILAPVFLESYIDLAVVIIYIAAFFSLPSLFTFAEKGFRNRAKDARMDFASREFWSDGEYPLVIADNFQGYVYQIIKCDDLILTYYIGQDPKGYDYRLIQLGDKALRPLSKRDRCFYLKDVDSIVIDNSPSWRLGRDFSVLVTVGNSTFLYTPSLFWPDRDSSGETLKMFWEDMLEKLEAIKAGSVEGK